MLFFHAPASAQDLSGVPGYFRIPTATFNKDGTLYFGASYLPRTYLDYTKDQYDALDAYASITFLSFVEVDISVTRILGLPKSSNHVSDRVPTIRFRILKEKKWIPGVTIGLHDVVTSLESGVARHFGASYLVVTKNFHIEKAFLNIEATLGYGSNWLIWYNNEFIGPFGGISLSCDKFKWMSLMFDYDGRIPSTGIRVLCFNHLSLMAGFLNFSSFTGNISYRFFLKK